MALPKDAQARKDIPIYLGFVTYFPDAMAAVAELSKIANEQHSPGQPVHWAKGKSQDELDALLRHLIDAQSEDRDEEGVLHMVKVAWRAMANVQRMADRGENIFAEAPRPPHRELHKHECRNCGATYRASAEQVCCPVCIENYIASLND